MFGRHTRHSRRDTPAPATAPVEGASALEAVALARSFDDVRAVDGLSFAVAPGELYGLVGPDGAGKTTTIRMLTGLVDPTSGQANVLGMLANSGVAAVRESIGYMPQQYSLYGDLSVDENLSFFARLFGVPAKEAKERRADLLAITRLSRFGHRRADALSGGMYKKLALACALLHRPRVLILDEPSNGVDPVSRRELWDLLYTLVADGMAVVISTPYMDEAARCHRVGLLHQGRLMAEGAPATLVAQFPHSTLMVRTEDRAAAEVELHARPEILALSPHGGDLRVVVDVAGLEGFRDWAGETALVKGLESVTPDFEDVYLGLLAGRE